ncbi:DUF805 domain-containing protein [Bradyrhizobium sp. USDA 4516]
MRLKATIVRSAIGKRKSSPLECRRLPEMVVHPTASIATCFRKFADFTGRASRAEFWWFFGFCLLLLLAAHQLDKTVYAAVAIALPLFAVTARRFHDSGLTTGLAVFFAVAPFVIFYFFSAVQDRIEAWFGVHVPYGLIAAIPAICAFAFSAFCFLAALGRRSLQTASTARARSGVDSSEANPAVLARQEAERKVSGFFQSRHGRIRDPGGWRGVGRRRQDRPRRHRRVRDGRRSLRALRTRHHLTAIQRAVFRIRGAT